MDEQKPFSRTGALPPPAWTEAPVFRPTADEFLDPMAYICSIRKQAESAGIAKIVPPAGWKPNCKLDNNLVLATRTQFLDGLEATARCRNIFVLALRKYLFKIGAQVGELPQLHDMPWDLLALFQAVRVRGGHAAAAAFSDQVWTAVAIAAWSNTPGASAILADAQAGTAAKAVYDKFLRNYDVHLGRLAPDSRKPALEEFYQLHNPQRLASVDTILEDYPDSDELNTSLHEKYGMDLRGCCRMKLTSFFSCHDPANLPNVDRIVQDYSDYGKLNAMLREKYDADLAEFVLEIEAPQKAVVLAPACSERPALHFGELQNFAGYCTSFETLVVTIPRVSGTNTPLGLKLARPVELPVGEQAKDAMHPLLFNHIVVVSVSPVGRACLTHIRPLDILVAIDGADVYQSSMEVAKNKIIARLQSPALVLTLKRPLWHSKEHAAEQSHRLNAVIGLSQQQHPPPLPPTPLNLIAMRAGPEGSAGVHSNAPRAAFVPAAQQDEDRYVDMYEVEPDAWAADEEDDGDFRKRGAGRGRRQKRSTMPAKVPPSPDSSSSSRRSGRKRTRTARLRETYSSYDAFDAQADDLGGESPGSEAGLQMERAAFPGKQSLLERRFWKFFPTWGTAIGVVSCVKKADGEAEASHMPVAVGKMGAAATGKMASAGASRMSTSGAAAGSRMQGSPSLPQTSTVPDDSLVYMVRYPDSLDVPIRHEWIKRKDLQGFILCGRSSDEARDACEHGVCQICSRAHNQDYMLSCTGCRGQYHLHCLKPQPVAPRGERLQSLDFFCTECMSTSRAVDEHIADAYVKAGQQDGKRASPRAEDAAMYSFGYEEGPSFTLQRFKEYADNFKASILKGTAAEKAGALMPQHQRHRQQSNEDQIARAIELQYWDTVSLQRQIKRGREHSEPLAVLYGSDQDTNALGSGFPTLHRFAQERRKRARAYAEGRHVPNVSAMERQSEEDRPYWSSGWNLVNLPTARGSILQHAPGRVTGITSPWLYVGMLFSSFSWHVEDHNLASINYLHKGASKSWWGASGSDYDQFTEIARGLAPQIFEQKEDLLMQLVTQFDPRMLSARGLRVSHAVQREGEFVITFPRAFHAGFNHGYNCAEACNFANADWFQFGRSSIQRYRRFTRDPVLPHHEFVYRVAEAVVRNNEREGFETLLAVRQELVQLAQLEFAWRCFLCKDSANEVHDCTKDGRFLFDSTSPDLHELLGADLDEHPAHASLTMWKTGGSTPTSLVKAEAAGPAELAPPAKVVVAQTPFMPPGELVDLRLEKDALDSQQGWSMKIQERSMSNSWLDINTEGSLLTKPGSHRTVVVTQLLCAAEQGHAERCGMHVGDVVVAVNGRPAIAMSLDEIKRAFVCWQPYLSVRVLRMDAGVKHAAAVAASAAREASTRATGAAIAAQNAVEQLLEVNAALNAAIVIIERNAAPTPTSSAMYQPPVASSLGAVTDEPLPDEVCKACGWGDDGEHILLCDRCDAEYHLYCLDPPLAEVPAGDWFCPTCVQDIEATRAASRHLDLAAPLQLSASAAGRERSVDYIRGYMQCCDCHAFCSWSAVVDHISPGDTTAPQHATVRCFQCHASQCESRPGVAERGKRLLLLRSLPEILDTVHQLNILLHCQSLPAR